MVGRRHVGVGEAALVYLSRYLYRGVISAKNILADQANFRYNDSQSCKIQTDALPGAALLWRAIQHVLPSGFQRVGNYGLRCHNAWRIRQLVLWVIWAPRPVRVLSLSLRRRLFAVSE